MKQIYKDTLFYFKMKEDEIYKNIEFDKKKRIERKFFDISIFLIYNYKLCYI